MIEALAVLLLCQLGGEAIRLAVGLPLPGSIVGMALLFAWLRLRPDEHAEMKSVAGKLIAALPLLLTPYAMGLLDQMPELRAHGIALLIICFLSTLATILVTAAVFQWVARRTDAPVGEGGAMASDRFDGKENGQ